MAAAAATCGPWQQMTAQAMLHCTQAAVQSGLSAQRTTRMHLMSTLPLRASAAMAALLAAPLMASAQVTLKPDNQWRYLLTAGANASTGNSKSTALNLSAEAARVSNIDKWTMIGQANYARNDGVTETERYALGTQYTRDLTPVWFGFGTADALRDPLANLSMRLSVASGVGYHLIRNERNNFDISGGLGYSRDRYDEAARVDGQLRDTYGRLELVLAEESNHKLTDTTSLRQRFAVFPNLRDTGEYRATFDTNITVAMTKDLNLTAGLSYRYNSDPGVGVKKTDAMFITGVSLRFD
jgi:putative salt-induced outer membrane protein